MRYKIVVIASHYLCRPTEQALKRLGLDCEFIVVPYDDFEHITDVYDQYAQSADGFLISGRSAMNMIQNNTRQAIRPMVSFQVDTASLYKELLQLVLKNREQDLSRVVMDALLPVENGYTAAHFLARTEVDSLNSLIDEWMRKVGGEDMGGVEAYIREKLFSLWDAGEVDMVICQYSSIIPELERRGIPYRYPFLSDYQLGECVREIQIKIELEHLRENLPAIVYITPRDVAQMSGDGASAVSSGLAEFFREQLMDHKITEEHGSFAVELTIRNVRHLTQNSTACALSAYLHERFGMDFAVGYGVGSNVQQAMSNARAAAREAAFSGKSYIMDEMGNLIGPLDSEHQMTVSTQPVQNVGEIAKRCNLSTMTIQKLLTNMRVNGTNKTTTQELSSRFGVTVRNANRILSNLEKGGCARIIYSQTNSTKGRPVKVYELDFDRYLIR